MSLQVKIVMAAINTACLIVTLACPTDVTPLILLTTIASTVTWAFTKQDRESFNRKWQFVCTGIASFLAIACIVLGVTATISHPANPKYAGEFVFTFDNAVLWVAGKSFDYSIFAVFMCILIVVLMGIELGYSYVSENPQKPLEPAPQPIAHFIKQELADIT